MKKILVAIDFSDCSINALKYSVRMAKTLDASVTMIYVNKPGSAGSVYPDTQAQHLVEAKSRFENLMESYSSELNGRIDYTIREGKIYKEIAAQAKYMDSYLVVAGTHGVSGFEEFWIGSNAFRLVSTVQCPIITIREMFDVNRDIKKILLPIDHSIVTRQKVTLAGEMALLFNAEIVMLGIYSSGFEEFRLKVRQFIGQITDHYNAFKVPFKTDIVENKDICEACTEHAKLIDADLIVAMKDMDSSGLGYYLGNDSQKLINHSPVPVLSIDSKSTFKQTSSFSGSGG
ncbi:MAG: universal stress protein [Bacteroidales bacterium]|nr:universal stress protein [Bacteroidales bacterium]